MDSKDSRTVGCARLSHDRLCLRAPKVNVFDRRAMPAEYSEGGPNAAVTDFREHWMASEPTDTTVGHTVGAGPPTWVQKTSATAHCCHMTASGRSYHEKTPSHIKL